MNEILVWFEALTLAELLGVIGFILSVLIIFVGFIRWIFHFSKRTKITPALSFKLEDVNHEMFKKKGFVTFDLYVRNNGQIPIDLLQVGLLLSDGTELPIYDEPHKLKTPDISMINSGQEAFYDNCDLYLALNSSTPNYKKITGFYADMRNAPRFYAKADIHPLLNDQTLRGILTDRKGMNGF